MQGKVIFIAIQQPRDKITLLLSIAHEAFSKKEPLYILVENNKAADYIDALLWATPKNSFLPHGPQEIISIGMEPIPEDVFHVFNTSKKSLSPKNLYITTLYEFEEKSEEGQKIFSEKYKYYTQKGFTIVSR